jgi:hypothetical protein
MKTIHNITNENFNSSFNLIDILQDSVYYPASGLDATPIEVFGNKYYSYINVDYSQSYEDVRKSMEFDFEKVGYKLVDIKDVTLEELTPNGRTYSPIELNEHELKRLKDYQFINDLYYSFASSGYAIWAIYELDDDFTGVTNGKAKRFSLLHICGEGWSTFKALYVQNKINPRAIAIINPGEGYGDNWTKFTDYKFRFYQSIRKNVDYNGAEMPDYMLTNAAADEEGYFLGDFAFAEKFPILNCSLYELERQLYLKDDL